MTDDLLVYLYVVTRRAGGDVSELAAEIKRRGLGRDVKKNPQK